MDCEISVFFLSEQNIAFLLPCRFLSQYISESGVLIKGTIIAIFSRKNRSHVGLFDFVFTQRKLFIFLE